MKPSRYCRFFDIDNGKALLFNGANGALAEIDQQSYPVVTKLLSGNEVSPSDADPELWTAMVENGFLVEADADEATTLETSSRTERCSSSTLSLTIAPTLACNFACDYCFERQSPVRMTEEGEQALLTFAANHMEQMDNLLVTWFGGEPTLCMPTIERLQLSLIELADQHNVKVDPASIITNGYVLNIALASRLKGMGITTAQVTLDGPQEAHDARRKLRNGKGTYTRIMDNIAEASAEIEIVVRINIDRDNVDSAVAVLGELGERGLLGRVNAHFAPVTASGEGCASVRDRCFTDEEFAHSLVNLYQKLFDMGIYVFDYPQVFSGGHCGAVSNGSYVIAPNGLLFACWEELSLEQDKSIGSILTTHLDRHQKDKIESYRTWDPFKMSDCKECDILPVCMGGCPVHGMMNGDEHKGACSPYKHNLKDMLVLRYLCDTREEVRQ